MPEVMPAVSAVVRSAPCHATTRKQHVQRGQLLMSAEPFVYVVKADCVRTRCCYCLESAAGLQRCSGCQLFYFCGRHCQRKAWTEFHRAECRRMRAVAPRLPPDTAILLSRLIVRLRNGGDRHSERISDIRRRRFADLESHYTDLKTSPIRMEHVISLAAVLKALIGEEGFPNMSELTGLYGRICVNSFNILNWEMIPVAIGVYLAPSIIDHSCVPNACATFSGRRIAIRALQDIPDFSWDKLRISYIDTLADRATRRCELRAGYFFDCGCSRCRDEEFICLERALLCGTADCAARVELPAASGSPVVEVGDVSSSESPRCSHCGFSDFPADAASQIAALSETTRQLAKENIVYYDSCMRCLKLQRRLLHPDNVHRVKVTDLALEAAISNGLWEAALELAEPLISGYRLYYGPYHPLLGVLYMKLGKMALYRFQHAAADRYLRAAGHVLAISHGADHPLLCETLYALLRQLRAETEQR